MKIAFVGRASRQKPNRLGGKLKRIRETLGLSQNGMLIRLRLQDNLLIEQVFLVMS